MTTDSFPLVSIIVPSFNQGRFIGDTLRSIINQDYPRLEIIVMDAGSTDETADVVGFFGDYVQLVCEPDNGQSDAINKGFKRAQGEIVAWLNSDDIYLFKDSISSVVEQFLRCPDVDVLFGDYIRIDEKNRFLKAYRVWGQFNMPRLLRVCYISQPTVFFRSDVVREAPLDVSLFYGMDLDLWLNLGARGTRFQHIERFVAAERIHCDAKTVANPMDMTTEATFIRQRYAGDIRSTLSKRNLVDKIGLATFRISSLLSALSFYFRRDTIIPLSYRNLIGVVVGQLSAAGR